LPSALFPTLLSALLYKWLTEMSHDRLSPAVVHRLKGRPDDLQAYGHRAAINILEDSYHIHVAQLRHQDDPDELPEKGVVRVGDRS
jgi:hypothetical protein